MRGGKVDFDVFEVKEFIEGLFGLLHVDKLDKKEFGQIYAVIIKPGEVRGNHYHNEKEEWNWIVSGKALFVMENKETKQRREVVLDSKQRPLKGIRISPGIPHSIKNTGDGPAIMIEYSTQAFKPGKDDRYPYKIK